MLYAKSDVELDGRLVSMPELGVIIVDVEEDRAYYSVHRGCEGGFFTNGRVLLRCGDRHHVIELDD